jgi:hypothetical protein
MDLGFTIMNRCKSLLYFCWHGHVSGKEFLIFERQVDEVWHQLTVDLLSMHLSPLESRISYWINVFSPDVS